MSGKTRDTLLTLARRIHTDPTADAEKKQLARGLLLALEGRIPK